MKAQYTRVLMVLCMISLSTPYATAMAEEIKMTFACEDKEDFPALIGNSTEIDPVKPGVAVEIIKIVGKKLGISLTFKRVPWKRALEVELGGNNVDGLFTASYKKERETVGRFPMKDGQIDTSRKFSTVTYVFYKKKNSDADYDGKDVKNLKGSIGAPRGYSIVEDLQKKAYAVEESNSTMADLKKLALGRVGLVAALELTGDDILRTNPDLNDSIEKISTPISTKGYYFMLSHQFVKNNPVLAEKIWTEIAETSAKSYFEIMKKYLH